MSRTSSHRASSVLVAALLLTGCARNPDAEYERYAGPVDPCAASVVGETGVTERELEPGRPLWWDGPFPTWNTHPGVLCDENPRLEITDADREVLDGTALFITYPADTDPSITGRADVAAGRFPVVVFAHANNDTQCEIFEDYWSLHEHWASWGFVVASIDNTRFNCSEGTASNIIWRHRSQLAALEKLRQIDRDPDSRFHGRVDTDRVIFAGHSRGGGASLLSAEADPDSLGAMTLQGIQLGPFGLGWEKLPAFPVLGMTAGRDVDVTYPRAESTEDQLTGRYSWVNVNGGIHAYTADGAPLEFDDRPGTTRGRQHNTTELFTTAFLLHLAALPLTGDYVTAAHDILFTHAGAQTVLDNISEDGVYQRWRGPFESVSIDDFDNESENASQNLLDEPNRAEGLVFADIVPTYRPWGGEVGRYRNARSLLLHATRPGDYVFELGDQPFDVPRDPALTFRVKRPDEAPLALLLEVDVVTDDGSHTFDAWQHAGPLRVDNRFQEVVIGLADSELDLTTLREVRLRVGAGMVQVDDIAIEALTGPPGF